MQKWEYHAVTYGPPRNPSVSRDWEWYSAKMAGMAFGEGLNHLGTQGWEMCGSTVAKHNDGHTYDYVFKRPIA